MIKPQGDLIKIKHVTSQPEAGNYKGWVGSLSSLTSFALGQTWSNGNGSATLVSITDVLWWPRAGAGVGVAGAVRKCAAKQGLSHL